MNLTANKIKEGCREQFVSLYEMYKKTDGEVLLSYFGGLDQSLTFILSNKVEKILEDHEPSRSIVKRIFSILIESLQNIRLHSFKSLVREELAGVIVVKFSDYYDISVTNLTDENGRLILENRINEINALSMEQLKKRYMETMTDGVISDKGGAGLGIITIALKSRDRIAYTFHQISSGLYVLQMRFRISSSGN